jgi:hypothetical protein
MGRRITRRRLIIVLAPLLALWAGLLLLRADDGRITIANINRIQSGMSLDEVEAIFSPPEDQWGAGGLWDDGLAWLKV